MTDRATAPRTIATPPRRILSFFATLVGLSIVLMWPWSTVERGTAWTFKTVGNGLFNLISGDSGYADDRGQPVNGLFGSTVAARLEVQFTDPDPFGEHQRDIAMGVLNFAHAGQDGWQRVIRLSSRHLAYIPLAGWFAVALATPVSLRRRLSILGLGLPVIVLFVVLRFGLILGDAFEGEEAHCAVRLTTPWSAIMDGLVATVADGLTVTYLLPVGLWIVIVFYRGDHGFLGLGGWPQPHGTPASPRPGTALPARRKRKARRRGKRPPGTV